ncbi:hypothetical protein [Nocardia carnea]|uniref:hypothetical protein n=1 Tax=Nocardia carnea TaxID=37328 RepID=UPI0024563E7A|nr:hypothetical protein [Nocardia carnea]
MSVSRACLPVLAAALLTAGCAASEPPEPSAPQHTAPAAPDSAASVRIEVRIAGGVVTPVGSRLDARAGQPIEVIVDSDASDELHVHANPEHTFAVTVGAGQRFRFTVDVPGRVDIELHHAGVTVATLLVRP